VFFNQVIQIIEILEERVWILQCLTMQLDCMIYLLSEKRGKRFRQKNFEVVNPSLYVLTDFLHDQERKFEMKGR